MIQFQQTQQALHTCQVLLQQSVATDMLEIKMSLVAALPLGFAAPTLAVANKATAQLQAAQATAASALQSAQATLGWLSQSEDSSGHLGVTTERWNGIQRQAHDIEELMTQVQQRGRGNFWHGMTKEEWEAFTSEHLSSHRALTAELERVPGLIANAKHLTDRLMMEASVCTTQMRIEAATHAQRPLLPGPGNLAMGTRTIGVAAACTQGAAKLQAMYNGPWRPAASAGGAALGSVAQSVQTTSPR